MSELKDKLLKCLENEDKELSVEETVEFKKRC